MKYIVASGNGYFRRFVGDTPEMDSDPVCGQRMCKAQAKSVKNKLEKLGFDAYLILVREGKIRI